MKSWNKRLKRQLLKHFDDQKIPDDLTPLFQSISDSYEHYERENILLERILNLSSEELYSTNTKLRKRNQELDKFVYSTSHDLRAPLTSIMGLLQLIEIENDPKNINKYLGLIKTSALNLDNFIKDIVDYTHNNKKDVEYRQIDFEELVSSCLEKVNYMPSSYSIEKHISVKSSLPFYSDYRRLGNLLTNLISNAIKYCNSSRNDCFLKIIIETDEEQALISIEDNGIGISKEHISKVFNMFYRASDDSKGSGIGLYIVKEIVDKLKGTITVASDLGKGTIFQITIPNHKISIPNTKEAIKA